MSEFQDLETMSLWLKDKPLGIHSGLAVRAALRSFPCVAYQSGIREGFGKYSVQDLIVLVGRLLLTSATYHHATTRTSTHDPGLLFALSAAKSALASHSDGDKTVGFSLPAEIAADSSLQSAMVILDKNLSACSLTVESAANSGTDISTLFNRNKTARPKSILQRINEVIWKPEQNGDGSHKNFYQAAALDTLNPSHWGSLWHEHPAPSNVERGWGMMKDIFATSPDTWEFWQDWYNGFLFGNPVDWETQRNIAKIPDPEWAKGARHIAEIIKGIRDERSSDPDTAQTIPKSKLSEQVTKLLENPEMTALSAEGAAELLDRAMSDFLSQAKDVTNCLPEELQHLEYLPAMFRRISTLVKSGERVETKAKKLEAEIKELNAKVAALEADLKAALEKTLHGRFKTAAIDAAGKAFGASLVGGTAFATAHFFGFQLTDLTLENLRGWSSEIKDATPIPDTLPHATDV